MRRLPLLLLALAGCERDPTFFGYWEVARIERAGAVQRDAGFLEVLDDGGLALFLRYGWDGAGFFPEPRPQVIGGDTSQREQDFVDGYREKGETFTLWLSPFDTDFDVPLDRYRGDRAVLESGDAGWPGNPLDRAPTALTLQR